MKQLLDLAISLAAYEATKESEVSNSIRGIKRKPGIM
jgi:hypothetical protein